MKISNSFKAFVISFLVTGNLALLLWGYQISDGIAQSEEESYDIEYNQELLEEFLAAQETQNSKSAETNKAFNETKKEIAKTKVQSEADSEDFNDRLAALDNAIEDVKNAKDNQEEAASNFKASKADKTEDRNNENSTNSYRLVDRTDVYFPTPIYTCQAPGVVVVNITVDNNGQVIDKSINEAGSNTTNECLWDMALEYAGRTLFNESQKASQLGSITYRFPGQN